MQRLGLHEKKSGAWSLIRGSAIIAVTLVSQVVGSSPAFSAEGEGFDLASRCSGPALAALTAGMSSGLTVAPLPKNHIPGPHLEGGVRLTPAANGRPAYCQITGSFVTNPDTGKTAGFLATFPENWNGKYLQIGCGGHCGTFAVSDAASPTISITTQGKPGDIIERGYASIATDEGHVGMTSGAWAVQGPGKVDQEAIDDLLYRAHKVLSSAGKEFTRRFYATGTVKDPVIQRSYFTGCSGGGRDALVAASYFPEAFDGFIAGSPYANMAAGSFQGAGTSLATLRTPDADVSPELVALIDPIVKRQCDAKDGVEDGLIQNPMACDFRPETDLPRCEGDKPGEECFTTAQIQTLSTVLTAVTDEHGKVVQPGYSVSELQPAFRLNPIPDDRSVRDPWPDTGNPATGSGGMGTIANAAIKVLAHENDPEFHTRDILSFAEGGDGPVTGYRVVVPREEVDFVADRLRMGVGAIPENYRQLIEQDRKLLLWINLGDQLLTPYTSINFYKRLAQQYGGYDKLQDNARLFSLPGTAHCSGGLLAGPGSFDALAAMDDWVEKGRAPNALLAYQYLPTMFGADFSKPPIRSMPLCQFPQMARYDGEGDVNDAANWSCPEGDTGMLKLGASGIQAGVLPQ